MDTRAHWENVYRTKRADAVSWYRPHLDRSLELIETAARYRDASILDVGGGASTLVDDLLSREYNNVTILDVSQAALDLTRERLGESGERGHEPVKENAHERVRYICGDVTEAELPERSFDLWHDRAVFHFLTQPLQRAAYVDRAARALKPGGRLIVATFGPDGPTKCSGLDAIRYDAHALHREFGERFDFIESSEEMHSTPPGTTQQFLYCVLMRSE